MNGVLSMGHWIKEAVMQMSWWAAMNGVLSTGHWSKGAVMLVGRLWIVCLVWAIGSREQ
jgi:hypothetical protein